MIEHEMRKKSREMDADFAIEVFRKAPYITMSMISDNNMPYCIPLSMVVVSNDTFYFHCAKDGQKLDCIKQNNNVCLSAVTKCKPTIGPKDNSFTLEYKSAVAYGQATIVTDPEERIETMRAICERFLPNHMAAFDNAVAQSMAHTEIVKITLIAPPKGKRKQYDNNGEEMKYGRKE